MHDAFEIAMLLFTKNEKLKDIKKQVGWTG